MEIEDIINRSLKTEPDGTETYVETYTRRTFTPDSRSDGERKMLLNAPSTNDSPSGDWVGRLWKRFPFKYLSGTGSYDCTPKKLMGCFILFFLVLVIPCSMVYVGIRDWNACPVQPMIPVSLVFSGATFIFMLCLSPFAGNCAVYVLLCILTPLYIAWQITGSVYTFQEFSDWKSKGGCRGSTYEFAFAILVIFWPFLLIVFICIACAGKSGS